MATRAAQGFEALDFERIYEKRRVIFFLGSGGVWLLDKGRSSLL